VALTRRDPSSSWRETVATEEDEPRRRLEKSRRDCRRPYRLAGAPADSPRWSGIAAHFARSNEAVSSANCELFGPPLRANCLQFVCRCENIPRLRQVKGTVAASTGEGRRGVLDPALEVRHERAPPHGCTWDGAVHRPRNSRRLRRATKEGRWCLGLSLSALSAPSHLVARFCIPGQ
jgi:hypothetical protein